MNQNICKTCRRLRQKIFLKGEKCLSPKCPMVKRPYPPGIQKKRGGFRMSEYGKELIEKQKLKKYYGLKEKQFRNCIKDVMQKRGGEEDAALALIKKLEKRLDNVVFRLGLARSRKEAREFVSHSHFLVNSKPVNIPSFVIKKGDIISVKESKKKNVFFKTLKMMLKNYQTPAWLKLDKEKLEGKVAGEPSLDELDSPVDIPSIFEFYSR
ncbi:MAG: 30S ribosomal protein S4 [Parcubacteria group bacterium]|nr:30S ribosomal protein S4 [Parcubacteria group bacterium]